MNNHFSWKELRQRALNPPAHLTDWRKYEPKTPDFNPASRIIPSLKTDSFHDVSTNLNRANQLLQDHELDWHTTPRTSWTPNMRQARQHRDNALTTVLDDVRTNFPELTPFTNNFEYQPEAFTGSERNWWGRTGGWSDRAQANPAWRPSTQLNDQAFENPTKLNHVVRHEIFRQFERSNPDLFRGTWDDTHHTDTGMTLRRFHAPFRDLQNREAFNIRSREKLSMLHHADNHWNALQNGDSHWNSLTEQQRRPFNSYPTLRQQVCNELRDTATATHPEYSRICGSPSMNFETFQKKSNPFGHH